MDPTNPLSVAPPRYKYHPNPETITNFPAYRSESDVESPEDDGSEDDQEFSDEGSDFSDEEDRMPEVKNAKQAPAYDEESVRITWRKGSDEKALKQVTNTLIAVNQVALVLSQALEKRANPSNGSSSLNKIGYLTLQQPTSNKVGTKPRSSSRRIFTLWTTASDSTTTSPRTLLAVQIGRVSDRAVHVVSQALVNMATREEGISTTVAMVDPYIPQTYVPSAQPESRRYLDAPPVRFLKAKKAMSLASTVGIEKFESPNYVTGIGAGLLTCAAEVSKDSILLLVPKPFDGHTIIHAIKAVEGLQPAADALNAALRASDLDWEDVNYSSAGSRRSGRRANGKAYGTIGDGGMYV